MQQFVDAHYVRVARLLENVQLANHQLLRHLVFIDVLLLYDLNCDIDIGKFVPCQAHLPELTLTD